MLRTLNSKTLLNSIENIFFTIYKNFNISFTLIVLSLRTKHFKIIILKGQGGSEEKIRTMWLGLDTALAGHPPLLKVK